MVKNGCRWVKIKLCHIPYKGSPISNTTKYWQSTAYYERGAQGVHGALCAVIVEHVKSLWNMGWRTSK